MLTSVFLILMAFFNPQKYQLLLKSDDINMITEKIITYMTPCQTGALSSLMYFIKYIKKDVNPTEQDSAQK